MKIYFVIFLIALLSFGFGDFAREEVANQNIIDQLPFKISTNLIKPLRQKTNFVLQRTLEKKLKENSRWNQLINQQKMAVGLVDISDPLNVRYANVNGEVMMYAASLPKIAILLAAMQAIEDGDLELTDEVSNDLRIMISRSDNNASTRMIDRLGYKKINEVLTDPRYQLYDEDHGGGLWVGKRYASGGPRNPDPMLGLSHAATVDQICRFYYMLSFGNLVSFQKSEEMLDIMADPELHHKFVNSIEKLAPGAKLYRKSGTWQNYHSDSILVWDDGFRKYILAALVEAPNGEAILRNLVPVVEDVLKSSKK